MAGPGNNGPRPEIQRPELELSIIELEGGELSFAMVVRDAEHARSIHRDIMRYGGWRAYRADLGPPGEA
jgi:hypothetical protein